MALTDLGTQTDAIPLLDDNGSGVYIKGRNDVSDFRRQFLGALFGKSAGAFSPRTGVLATNYDAVNNNWTDKRISAQASPNQQITMGAGRSVVLRTNQGLYLISQETDLTVTMPGADGTNPRYDVLYEMPYDKGVAALGDTLHGPHLLCETGTPAGSPVVPTVPANANILATVFRRTSGATPSGNIIQAGDITDKRKSAGIHGAARVLLPGDLLADAGGYHGEIRMRTKQSGVTFIPTGWLGDGHQVWQDVWDAIGATWRGSTPSALTVRANLSGSSGVANGTVLTLGTLTIPDPGYPYRVRIDMVGAATLNAQTAFSFQVKTGGVGGTQAFNGGNPWFANRNGDVLSGSSSGPRYANISSVSDVSYTGSTTFTIVATAVYQNASGGADIAALINGITGTVLPI